MVSFGINNLYLLIDRIHEFPYLAKGVLTSIYRIQDVLFGAVFHIGFGSLWNPQFQTLVGCLPSLHKSSPKPSSFLTIHVTPLIYLFKCSTIEDHQFWLGRGPRNGDGGSYGALFILL